MCYCGILITVLDKIISEALEVNGSRQSRNLLFFSLSTCAMCKKGQRYLEEKGYPYRILYVDRLDQDIKDRLKEELSRKYGMRVVFPALLVDDSRIVLGFIRHAWNEALGEPQDEQ
jgi:glutaredoxin